MDILSNFAENLSALMAEHNLKAPKLAKILQIDRSNITRYQQGKRLPRFYSFLAIIDFFAVSADIILGVADYEREENFLSVPPFHERFREVLQETHTTQYALEKDLSISGDCVYNWLTGKSVPSIENVVKLAQYMSISVDYLLGRIK